VKTNDEITTPPQVWIIEVQICGVWDTYDEATSESDAITIASAIELPDDRIRISTPDHKIL